MIWHVQNLGIHPGCETAAQPRLMTQLSCLNHLSNTTVCLDEIQVLYLNIWQANPTFCCCLSSCFIGLNNSPHSVWLHNLVTRTGVQNALCNNVHVGLGSCDIQVHLKVQLVT